MRPHEPSPRPSPFGQALSTYPPLGAWCDDGTSIQTRISHRVAAHVRRPCRQPIIGRSTHATIGLPPPPPPPLPPNKNSPLLAHLARPLPPLAPPLLPLVPHASSTQERPAIAPGVKPHATRPLCAA
eukprot:scaffold7544_cov107-Isochrysis_galbana.AAC.10